MHEMKLYSNPFELIKNGKKRIEIRLYDEKRKLIKINDIIKFKNIDTNEIIKTKVVNIYNFNSFKELFSRFNKNDLGVDDYNVMYNYYSEEEEKKYGVVGIQIELI